MAKKYRVFRKTHTKPTALTFDTGVNNCNSIRIINMGTTAINVNGELLANQYDFIADNGNADEYNCSTYQINSTPQAGMNVLVVTKVYIE